ncbi:sialidase family protein [Saccharothrix stipae]
MRPLTRLVAILALLSLLVSSTAPGGRPNADDARLAAPAEPTADPESWRFTSIEEISGDGRPFDADLVVSFAAGFIAVRESTVRFWFSPDGTSWRRAPLDNLFPGLPGNAYGTYMLAEHDGKAYAFTREQQGGSYPTRPAAFATADGVVWQDVSAEFPFDTYTVPPAETGDFSIVAAEVVGASTDGEWALLYDSRSWTRAPVDGRWSWRPVDAFPFVCSIRNRATVDLGYLFMGGCLGSDETGEQPYGNIIALTRPGRLVDLHEEVPLSWGSAAASSDGSTLIFDPDSFTRSDDGRSWSTPVDLPIPDGFTGLQVEQAVGTDGGILVFGQVVAQGGTVQLPAVWRTDDEGTSWSFTQLEPYHREGSLQGVAEKDGRVVVLAHGFDNTKGVRTAGVFVNG